MIRRGGFGDEVLVIHFELRVIYLYSISNFRYELPEFQRKVKQCYKQLKDDTYWLEIDADKTENVLHEELKELTIKTMDRILLKPLDKLW